MTSHFSAFRISVSKSGSLMNWPNFNSSYANIVMSLFERIVLVRLGIALGRLGEVCCDLRLIVMRGCLTFVDLAFWAALLAATAALVAAAAAAARAAASASASRWFSRNRARICWFFWA